MSKNFCPKCGAPVHPHDAFCMRCGTPLGPDDDKTRVMTNSQQVGNGPTGGQPHGNQPGDTQPTNSQDPFSEASVKPVMYPGEELNNDYGAPTTYYDNRYDYQQTRVAPRVQPPHTQGPVGRQVPIYEEPKKSLAVPILVTLGALLIIAIIGVIVLIGLSTPKVQSEPEPKGPTIVTPAYKTPGEESLTPLTEEQINKNKENKEKAAQAPEAAEQTGQMTENDQKSYTELTNFYQKAKQESDQIGTLISTFNGSSSLSVAERKAELNKVEAVISNANAHEKELKKLSVTTPYKKNQNDIIKLMQMNKGRAEVLRQAYQLSIKYGDDAKEHEGEILKPFVDAYAPGQSRSKYLLEFERLYPEAKPAPLSDKPADPQKP